MSVEEQPKEFILTYLVEAPKWDMRPRYTSLGDCPAHVENNKPYLTLQSFTPNRSPGGYIESALVRFLFLQSHISFIVSAGGIRSLT